MAAKAKGNGVMSAEDAKAQAVLKMREWIEEVDSAERMQVGTWYEVPSGYERWRFVRCGLRKSDRAMALQATLRRMGYQDAPAGVRCAGFESDGANGLYMCVPEEVWRVVQDRKDRATQAIDDRVRKQMAADLGSVGFGPGSDVRVTGRTVSGSPADIAEDLRKGS